MERIRSDSSADPLRLEDTPSELDGVLADPAHHRVLFEDAEVRVVETRISAGEETPVHVHPQRRLVIALSGTSFARHDVHGNQLVRRPRLGARAVPAVAGRRPRARALGRAPAANLTTRGVPKP